MHHRCDSRIIYYLTLMTFDSHLWHIKTPEMTETKSKFRSKFRFRLYSVPATGRNFSGILNLAWNSGPSNFFPGNEESSELEVTLPRLIAHLLCNLCPKRSAELLFVAIRPLLYIQPSNTSIRDHCQILEMCCHWLHWFCNYHCHVGS
jgi:hypothetical protein